VPADIRATRTGKRRGRLEFTLDGRRYAGPLGESWNLAVRAALESGRGWFHLLARPRMGTGHGIIFLTKSQQLALQTEGLATFLYPR